MQMMNFAAIVRALISWQHYLQTHACTYVGTLRHHVHPGRLTPMSMSSIHVGHLQSELVNIHTAAEMEGASLTNDACACVYAHHKPSGVLVPLHSRIIPQCSCPQQVATEYKNVW